MVIDRPQSRGAEACPGRGYVPARQIHRANAGAFCSREVQPRSFVPFPARRKDPPRRRISNPAGFSNRLTIGTAARILFWKVNDAAMKRLLVPVDFSPAMDGVFALARQLAETFAADLHLVHVREIAAMPVFPAATTGYPGIGMPELGISGGLALDRSGFLATNLPNEKQI